MDSVVRGANRSHQGLGRGQGRSWTIAETGLERRSWLENHMKEVRTENGPTSCLDGCFGSGRGEASGQRNLQDLNAKLLRFLNDTLKAELGWCGGCHSSHSSNAGVAG